MSNFTTEVNVATGNKNVQRHSICVPVPTTRTGTQNVQCSPVPKMCAGTQNVHRYSNYKVGVLVTSTLTDSAFQTYYDSYCHIDPLHIKDFNLCWVFQESKPGPSMQNRSNDRSTLTLSYATCYCYYIVIIIL